MEDNAKCFIKINKGYYEEITYKELEKRRKEDDTYNNKRFIPIQKMLIEVSNEEYKDFYRDVERSKYVQKTAKDFKFISMDEISEDSDIREKNMLTDENINVSFEVERRIEIEQLKNALLELDAEEYKIIKALFYEENSIIEYAKKIGIPFTTLQSKKEKIIEKLKKFLKF